MAALAAVFLLIDRHTLADTTAGGDLAGTNHVPSAAWDAKKSFSRTGIVGDLICRPRGIRVALALWEELQRRYTDQGSGR